MTCLLLYSIRRLFVSGEDDSGGIIHNDVQNNNNESHMSRAINWLGRTISEQGSNVKGPNK